MNYYLMIVVIAIVVILTTCIELKREQLFNIHRGMEGIGKVLTTLYGQDESSCAVSCLNVETCTSFNLLSMTDGKHCQLLEMISSATANARSTMYGKNNPVFMF